MTLCAPDVYGQEPVNITWNVVRGDTANLRIDFFEEDEQTHQDTTGWSFVSNAYNPKTQTFQELSVTANSGYVIITAESDITDDWGSGIRTRVNELSFDLEVTLDDNSIWTPVRGYISVIGDVTGGTL
jgi:hypothetical protein